MRKLKQVFAALFCLAGCTPTPPVTPPASYSSLPFKPMVSLNWAAYYDTKRPADDFAALDMVIFDRRYHPDFRLMKKTTIVLAYVSLGEVYDNVPERKVLEKKNAILHKNMNWNSHVVDLTSREWRQMVHRYVDNALAQGFDGIMLDTVDSPLEWARYSAPGRRSEMQQAAASLIHEMRQKYPDIKIMLNRGFEIVPYVVEDIDYILAESILTYKDDSTGQYRYLPPKTYSNYADQLHAAIRSAKKNIKVMTLDYWDLDDDAGVRAIYQKQRDAGFSPYVTTPDLRNFTPEPLRRGPANRD